MMPITPPPQHFHNSICYAPTQSSSKKKFLSIHDVVGVSTNDGDFSGVVGDLGGRIDYILNHNEKKTMFNIQRFMLDMYPDIVCTVKGLRANDGQKRAVDLQQMVTWKVVTEGVSAKLFVDNNFKCINGN